MTLTTIVDSMLAVILTLDEVDTVSSSDFTPAITTQTIAALSPAFGIEIAYRWDTFGEASVLYRIPIEFWVKHSGQPATTMQRARNVGEAALLELLINDGTGYQLLFDDSVNINVDPALTTLNSQSWLVASMFVNVRTESSA